MPVEEAAYSSGIACIHKRDDNFLHRKMAASSAHGALSATSQPWRGTSYRSVLQGNRHRETTGGRRCDVVPVKLNSPSSPISARVSGDDGSQVNLKKETKQSKESKEIKKKGLFGFVTDNASSRGAIQLENTPAQDGNLGQMISSIENKGREYGFWARAEKFTWWVRKTGDSKSRKGTVMLLHGSPTQSYSYRVVMKQLADAGYQCYAPDWIGYGFSEKPQPGYDFAYTEQAYHDEFDKLLVRLDIKPPFFLVTQGFVLGSYGLTWALKNSEKVAKLAILNSPLTPSAPLPGLFQQLRLPLLGEFTSQNAILPERFVEGGSPYVLEIDDADVYRLPYLNSSEAGFSMLESVRKAPVKDLTGRIAKGFASKSWITPTLVAWGEVDKYLTKSEPENFSKSNPDVIEASILSGAGHLPQEDWPEKVVEALAKFFKRI